MRVSVDSDNARCKYTETKPGTTARARRLLALLCGLGGLDLFGAAELEVCVNGCAERRAGDGWGRTFFALFLRSFRSLRDAFSTLAARPDYIPRG
jgi:hypothetical protein